jgi:hypothetical protein
MMMFAARIRTPSNFESPHVSKNCFEQMRECLTDKKLPDDPSVSVQEIGLKTSIAKVTKCLEVLINL